MEKKSFFQEEYLLTNQKKIKSPANYNLIYLAIFIFSLYISVIITGFDLSVLFERASNFWEIIGEMIPPDWDYFTEVYQPLIATIQMSIVGTFFGAILSFPVAFIAARNTNPNKIWLAGTRFILSLLRTMPVLIYAIIFTYMFGLGEFAGIIAITIFTFGILTKMTYENIENLDMGSFEAAQAAGVTRLNNIIVTIIPQMIRSYYSFVLYSLEINVRSAAILGYVGAGGVGKLLDDTLGFRQYEKSGMIIFSLIIIVILIDTFSQYLRRRLKWLILKQRIS